MHEPKTNIGLVCPNCMDERKATTQSKLKNSPPVTGAYAKIALKDHNGTEHIWFKITSIINGSITGILDNMKYFKIMKLSNNFFLELVWPCYYNSTHLIWS